MPHAHAHHPHPSRTAALNRAFAWGIVLNVAFVAAECVAGLWYGSIGLLSDAGHNLSDVAGLVLALVAFRLARRRPTARYTYGYKKSTVLISLLNSLLLLLAAGRSSSRASSCCATPCRSSGRPSPGRRAPAWRSTASRRGSS